MSEQVNMAAHYEHEIPEGYEAKIEGNKVIIELKESEDERIRKNILALVKKHAVNHERCQMEIYLEKQKEQSFTHHEIDESLQDAVTHQMEDDGDVDDFVRRGIDDIALKYAMLGAQWQKEQNPTKKLSRDDYVKRFKALCDVYAIELPNREYDIYHLCDDLSKLSMDSGKQKPAEWNPNNEDVVLFNKAVITNTNLTPSERAKLDIIRMKFKHCNGNITKPAEWSDEDETRFTNIIIMLKEYVIHHYSKDDVNKSVNWLENRVKFLRPQPHWKPSEEQMKAMEEVRTIFHNHHLWDEINPILYDYEELMRDLKKLM